MLLLRRLRENRRGQIRTSWSKRSGIGKFLSGSVRQKFRELALRCFYKDWSVGHEIWWEAGDGCSLGYLAGGTAGFQFFSVFGAVFHPGYVGEYEEIRASAKSAPPGNARGSRLISIRLLSGSAPGTERGTVSRGENDDFSSKTMVFD